MVIIFIKEISEKLKDIRINVYVRDIIQRSWFSGILEEISNNNIKLREKTYYSDCRYYIPLAEIVVVSESDF
ncbi:MAG: hypothetical protein ACFFA4_14465 [Promethearchaeota archaeon]